MDERDFFDRMAPSWDDNETQSTPEKVRNIIKYLNIRPEEAILDLGTGTGILLPYLAESIGANGEITAVDFSSAMLDRAKSKYSNIAPTPTFLNLDIENETIPGEFDHIILYCVYPHLHSPIDTLKWLMKVNLKDNGIISIAFPCSEEFINNIHREKHSDSDVLLPAPKLAEFLQKNGLNAIVAADNPAAYVINITK